MSAGDRDTLAALLAEHEWHKYGIPSQPPRWYPTCGCGESFRAMRYDQAYEAHRNHLADVLLASGPWAEHLDAAKAEIVCPSCGKGCRQWNDGHITPGLWTLNCPDCGSFQLEVPETNLRAQLDAALARNAELERDLTLTMVDVAAVRADRDALRAELDNLRDRVTALADAEHSVEHLYEAEELRYTGVVMADELRTAIVRGSDDAGEDA